MTLFWSIWVWLWAGSVSMAFAVMTLIGSLFGGGLRFYSWIERNWGRTIMVGTRVKIEVQGMENIQMDRPQIVASNHQSWFDVFALAAVIPKKFRFVAKEELSRVPLWGKAWRTAGHISINRSDRRKAVRTLEHYGKVVREDNSIIVIFPEGTRSETGELGPFKKGAFMLALHMHLDIMPTAVIGSRAIMKKNDWRVHRGKIIVRFGKPIPTTQYSEMNREELIAIVHGRIQQLLNSTEPA